ncbi:hypothetical protein COO60DRAFT_1483020, partial [Scenedesmus sp. NREL 46B-D3]
MRVVVVAALLLGALACASAAEGSVKTSFPKPGTGRLTCILPVKNLRCTVDTRTGFVAGMRYGYGPYGDRNICSQGNSFQTTFDMSPVGYTQSITCPNGPVNPIPGTNIPNFPNGNPINEGYLMPYGSMITQVLVLEAPNPLGPKFGTIAAIAFRYTNEQLADAAEPCGRAPYSWAVCGNIEYAQAYLFPGNSPVPPPTGPVVLKAQYTSPLTEDGAPSFLGSFQAVCAIRGSGYLGGDPQTSSKFFIKRLKQVCFTRLAHPILAKPIFTTDRPDIDYNWNVPNQPCGWDKKNSKDSPSLSCVNTQSVVATGKYSVIYTDANGQPWTIGQGNDGKLGKVAAASVFMGTEPAGETSDWLTLALLWTADQSERAALTNL